MSAVGEAVGVRVEFGMRAWEPAGRADRAAPRGGRARGRTGSASGRAARRSCRRGPVRRRASGRDAPWPGFGGGGVGLRDIASGRGAQDAPVASSSTARASSFMAPNSSAKLGSTEAGLVAQRAYCLAEERGVGAAEGRRQDVHARHLLRSLICPCRASLEKPSRRVEARLDGRWVASTACHARLRTRHGRTARGASAFRCGGRRKVCQSEPAGREASVGRSPRRRLATTLARWSLRHFGRRRRTLAQFRHELVELGLVLGEAQPVQERRRIPSAPPPAGATSPSGIRRRRGCRWTAAGRFTAAAPPSSSSRPTARHALPGRTLVAAIWWAL